MSDTAVADVTDPTDKEYAEALASTSPKTTPKKIGTPKTSAPKNEKDEVDEEASAPSFCLCGCGQEVSRGRRFKTGHDAKFHSMVKKVERGELEEGSVPQTVLDEIKNRREQGIVPHEPLAKKSKAKAKPAPEDAVDESDAVTAKPYDQ